jgi:hypothetical protein
LLYGACAAGSRNEFNEPHDGLAAVFGLKPGMETQRQSGRFDLRGALNDLPWLDEISPAPTAEPNGPKFGVLGLKIKISPTPGAKVTGVYKDGSPAVIEHGFGKGKSIYAATCPAVSYAKDAKFVPDKLQEKWPATQRGFINKLAKQSGALKVAELSHPVVEAGIFEHESLSGTGIALILANFHYDPIPGLKVAVPLRKPPTKVVSMEKGKLEFQTSEPTSVQKAAGFTTVARFALPLGWNDIVVLE